MESFYDSNALDDLEIVVSHSSIGDGYGAYIRLPEKEIAFAKLAPPPFQSLEKASDPLSYGEQLFSWLFQGEVAEAFAFARKLASEPTRGLNSGARLRLRLSLDPTSVELRQLRWETLYTSDGIQPFSLTTAFSRFMHVLGPQNLPIRARPLRMLLIISNPRSGSGFAISKFDPGLEEGIVKNATSALYPQPTMDILKVTPTLAQVEAAGLHGIREDGDAYHIVHLLARTVSHADHGYLLLSDDAGQAQEVPLEDVVHAIATPASSPPRLVFLTVPLGTTRPGSGILINLAQMLIEAGVQALIAIQSPIDTPTLLRLVEHFYAALMRTGVIDIAMAEARNAIYNPDHWEWTYPVLYMRTPDARLFLPLPESLESRITGIRIERLAP